MNNPINAAERSYTAIALIGAIESIAEQLSADGGPACHRFAEKLVKQCKAEAQRQLAMNDAAHASITLRIAP